MAARSGVLWLIAALAALASVTDAQNLELPALPYDYHELEPHFDNQTMRIHHLVRTSMKLRIQGGERMWDYVPSCVTLRTRGGALVGV